MAEISFVHFHSATLGLEGGVSSLVGQGRNFEGGGVVKLLGMMKFWWAISDFSPKYKWQLAHKMRRAQLSQIIAGICSYALPCTLDGFLLPVLRNSASSSCCCAFSSNLCVDMAEQLCSNPWGTALVKAKIGTIPQKWAKNDQNLGVGSSFRMNKPLWEAIVSLEFHEIAQAGFTLKKVPQNSNSDAGRRTVFNAGSRINSRTTFPDSHF